VTCGVFRGPSLEFRAVPVTGCRVIVCAADGYIIWQRRFVASYGNCTRRGCRQTGAVGTTCRPIATARRRDLPRKITGSLRLIHLTPHCLSVLWVVADRLALAEPHAFTRSSIAAARRWASSVAQPGSSTAIGLVTPFEMMQLRAPTTTFSRTPSTCWHACARSRRRLTP
jgi:hypothetical protein